MPNPELTEELVRGPWLDGSAGPVFRETLDHLRDVMRGGAGPVLVAEETAFDFLAVFFAALLAGRPVVAGNPGWARQEWQQAFEMTGARQIRATGEAVGSSTRFVEAPEIKPRQILIPTGGTSGELRFARHSWATLTASAEGFCSRFNARPVNSVCVLPLFHVSGLMQVIRALVTGGQVVMADWRRLEAGEIPEAPKDFFLPLVPAQLRRLLPMEDLHPWLRKARAIPLGGAAAPVALLEQAASLRLPIALSYGATETAAMATAQLPAEFLRGDRSSGHALPHISVRIVGSDGEGRPAGEIGRICVGGMSLFDGYVSGGARERDEWMTGDLGFLDPEGRLTVLGREDDLMVTGGEKVFPGEVERVLLASGLVEDVVVVGVSDAEWGQAVTALYVPLRDAKPEQLRAVVKEELASYKVPKNWVAVAEISRTARGKIDREWVAALINADDR